MIREAKKKANELIAKFKDLVCIDYRGDEEPIYELQVQSAIIVVEEILSDFNGYRVKPWITSTAAKEMTKFWNFVLDELNEKLNK